MRATLSAKRIGGKHYALLIERNDWIVDSVATVSACG